MQLFICPSFEIQEQHLLIKDNPDLVMQLRKVLRAKPGYDFFIQDFSGNGRFQVKLVSYTDKDIFTNIL